MSDPDAYERRKRNKELEKPENLKHTPLVGAASMGVPVALMTGALGASLPAGGLRQRLQQTAVLGGLGGTLGVGIGAMQPVLDKHLAGLPYRAVKPIEDEDLRLGGAIGALMGTGAGFMSNMYRPFSERWPIALGAGAALAGAIPAAMLTERAVAEWEQGRPAEKDIELEAFENEKSRTKESSMDLNAHYANVVATALSDGNTVKQAYLEERIKEAAMPKVLSNIGSKLKSLWGGAQDAVQTARHRGAKETWNQAKDYGANVLGKQTARQKQRSDQLMDLATNPGTGKKRMRRAEGAMSEMKRMGDTMKQREGHLPYWAGGVAGAGLLGGYAMSGDGDGGGSYNRGPNTQGYLGGRMPQV